MRAIEDRFEEQWNRLQAGQRLADCQAMLPDDEAELLALAASLGDAPTPARDRGAVAGQRARLLSLAARQLAPVPHGRRQASPAPAGAEPARRPFWQAVVPQTPLARGLALALLLAVALVGASLAWRAARNDGATPAPVAVAPIEKLEPSAQPATVAPTLAAATRAASPRLAVAAPASGASAASPSAPAPSSAPALSAAVEPTRAAYLSAVLRPMTAEDAVLRDSRGLVQVQRDEGPWELADSGQVVGAGWRVRTGALSGVRLAFHDGSSARLGPESELSLEALGLLPDTGARRVELRQWRGESDHLVTPAPDGRYVVHTPAGSGAALGTHFQVHVSAEAGTRFAVAEGAVEVTHLEVSVVVVAGQATLVEPESPPDQPIFRVYGEGRVEAIGAVWRIGGQDFQTHAGTLILGDPHLGDWVAVEGRLAPDGTRLADRVELLERAPAPEFSLVGPLETMAAELWVIAGQSISITAQTDVEADLVVGDWVQATGVVLEDGTHVAQRVRSLGEPAGEPFHFAGIIESMAQDTWTVSGILISLDGETLRDEDLVVGDLVEVGGWITPQDVWLARSIRRLAEDENTFEFSGLVEAIDPWIVAGIALETRDWTEIEPGIAVGDRVKVEGRILADGTWLAAEIVRLDPQAAPRLEFVGTVEATDPWTVDGIVFAIDELTEIQDGIAVGDLVWVEAVGLDDHVWLLREIKRVEQAPAGGCMWFTHIVERVEPDRIVLFEGPWLPFGPEVPVEGELQRGSVIAFYLCVDAEGQPTLLAVIVLYQLDLGPEPEPTPTATPPPTPTEEPGEEWTNENHPDKVTICHKLGNGRWKTITVAWEAWVNAHKKHGDTLGPCP